MIKLDIIVTHASETGQNLSKWGDNQIFSVPEKYFFYYSVTDDMDDAMLVQKRGECVEFF